MRLLRSRVYLSNHVFVVVPSNCRSFSSDIDLYKQYASTLSLPKTKFANRPNANDIPRLLEETGSDLYEWQTSNLSEESTRVFHDGPPYANGDLHLGHALNKVAKDIINRSNVMFRRRVEYVPGWDCHGLPIEQKALEKAQKKLGSTAVKNMSIQTKRQLASKLANEMSSKQLQEFKKFGIMAGWSHNNIYKTLTADYVIRQLKVFRKMLDEGLISRQERPVYWSVESGTALAEAELQYEQKESLSAKVKYPVVQVSQELNDLLQKHSIAYKDINLAIWTTTPWTLVANKAIAVNPEMMYGIVQSESHGLLVVAEDRYSELPDCTPLGITFPGSLLQDTRYKCLLRNDATTYPVLLASFVTSTSGTGLVHSAPGHGNEDYLLGKQHGLEIYSPIDDFGRYNSQLPANLCDLIGLNARKQGQDAVISKCKEAGALLDLHTITHSIPFDWRSKTPVMVRSTPQFFADVASIKEKALKALDDVEFHPVSGKARLVSFTSSRNEWCISRQRAWGVPIPVVINKETGLPLLDSDIVGHIISKIETAAVATVHGAQDDAGNAHADPLDSWFSPQDDISEWLPAGFDGTLYKKGTDTMDVWFDSGTSWTMLKPRTSSKYLADYYLEGSDQHRGWFQSSLLTKIAVDKQQDQPVAPFKTIITHGFLLDEKGRKMSKSLGNIVTPHELIYGGKKTQGIGIDGMRLWIAQSDYTSDISLSPFIISQVGALVKKLRLSYKFLLGNLNGYQGQEVDYSALAPVDKKALADIYNVVSQVKQDYENYAFSKVVKGIQNHMTVCLSSFYFDIVKDRLYADQPDGISRRAVQYVLAKILEAYTTMLAPITPLLSQEVWQSSPSYVTEGVDSPFKHGFIPLPQEWNNKQIVDDFDRLTHLRRLVNETLELARSEKKVGSSLGADLYIEVDTSEKSIYQLLGQYQDTLPDLFITSAVHINEPIPRNLEWAYSSRDVDDKDKVQDQVVVTAVPAQSHKCPRCWKFTSPEPEKLCNRCHQVSETV